MAKYRRLYLPGGTYFFTVVTFDRRPFLTADLARRWLRSAWIEVRPKYPFELDALCLLPDHLHCLWTLPEGDVDYSTRWKAIKGGFSRRYLAAGGAQGDRSPSRWKKGEAALWQRRFWEHTIRNDEDLRRHYDYIHYNPVRHGLVRRPFDWPWSTFRRYVRMGWYHREWGREEPASVVDFDCIGE